MDLLGVLSSLVDSRGHVRAAGCVHSCAMAIRCQLLRQSYFNCTFQSYANGFRFYNGVREVQDVDEQLYEAVQFDCRQYRSISNAQLISSNPLHVLKYV